MTTAARTFLEPRERVVAIVSVKKDAPIQGKLMNVKRDAAPVTEAMPAAAKGEKNEKTPAAPRAPAKGKTSGAKKAGSK